MSHAPSGQAARAGHAGWSGEQLFGGKNDDWEPAVAADPVTPRVYILTTRYGGKKACHDCPDPALILRTSTDGGETFGPDHFLCACKGIVAQNDPQIEVANDGKVYAAWLNDYVPGVVFSKSSDHGRSWTAPITLKTPAIEFGDKPALAISPSGRDVYVAWNASNSYVSVSHDFGATFDKPIKTNADTRYWYAYTGAVAPDGTITFAETDYTQDSTGPVNVEAIRSTDGGKHWKTTLIDTVEQQPTCVSDGCPPEFYGPSSLDVDGRDRSAGRHVPGRLGRGGPAAGLRPSVDGWRQDLVEPDRHRRRAARHQRGLRRRGGDGSRRLPPLVPGRPQRIGRVEHVVPELEGRWPNVVARDASLRSWQRRPVQDRGRLRAALRRLRRARDHDTGRSIAVWSEGTSYSGPGGTWNDLTNP